MAVSNPGDKMMRVCKVKSIDKDATISYANKPGTYNGVELIYEQEFNGQKELKTKNFAMKSLDHPANSAMRTALMQLEKGATFTAHYVKGEQYWDLKDITLGAETVSAAPARANSGGGNFPQKDKVSADNKSGISDFELGIVTGHALNNAVLLLGEGATIAQVKAKAGEFLAMAMEFKEEVKAGNFGGKQESSAASADIPQMAPKKPVQEPPAGADFNDDLPF